MLHVTTHIISLGRAIQVAKPPKSRRPQGEEASRLSSHTIQDNR